MDAFLTLILILCMRDRGEKICLNKTSIFVVERSCKHVVVFSFVDYYCTISPIVVPDSSVHHAYFPIIFTGVIYRIYFHGFIIVCNLTKLCPVVTSQFLPQMVHYMVYKSVWDIRIWMILDD